MAEAARRKMTGAVESGLQPTEAALCNLQTCSCLLEGLLLLLLPDMAAGTACCKRSGRQHCGRHSRP